VNLPSAAGNGEKILRQKSDETGFEYIGEPYSKVEADARYAEITGGANANFTAMPQVGGDPIVESGSNADGEWTRWADGTQICTGTYTTLSNDSADSDIGGLFRTSFTDVVDLPISFIDTDYLPFCARAGGDSGFDYQGFATSTGNFNFISIRGTSGMVSAGVSFQFHTIGRWK
jgi:hypothetical protein